MDIIVGVGLSDLRNRVARIANEEGLNVTAIPGFWVFHSSCRSQKKPSVTKMVTFAAVLQGRKRVVFDDLALSYDAGSYLFVTGERRYLSSIGEATPQRPYLSLALQITPEEIADVMFALTDAGLRFDEGPVTGDPAFVARMTPEILGALTRMVQSLDDPISSGILAPLAKRELLVHLLRGPAGATLRRAAAVDDGRIRRALAYLDAHAKERITVDQVARHVSMSPSHFAHRFRDVVRMSPMQYLKHVRLRQARLLMLGEGLGAAEAGASVGYASPSHFARDFKGYFGAPPATYVQRFRLAS